eukprot:TRINITY_DN23636_c0_g1_i1.p1 TRINITY_DN23636_c0_g1~~TRINITY_DN23636_c0_g1_i1.p1  ORF type:complete len:552 (-),score=138.16 TRINITY_DN23636_c0_g1_i1:679-2184(-)
MEGVSLDEFLRLGLDREEEGPAGDDVDIEWERAKMRLLQEEHERQLYFDQEQRRREADERERLRAVELEAVMRATLEEEKAKERSRIEAEMRAEAATRSKEEEEQRLRLLEDERRRIQLLGQEKAQQYEHSSKQLQEERARLNALVAQLERQRADISAKEAALVQKESALVNKEVALQQQANNLMQQSSALSKKEQEVNMKEISAQHKSQEAALKAQEVALKEATARQKIQETVQLQEAIALRSAKRTALLSAHDSDYFDEANFQRWISIRLGSGGKTTYWYSSGELYSYPEGRMLVRVEGFDATRALVMGPNVVHQLSRKVFVFRDKDTNEVLSQYNGTPVKPIKFPYQHISYTLDGKQLLTEATGGTGEDQTTLRGNVVSVRHMHGTTQTVFTCPVFLNLQTANGSYLAYENYDYFMDKSEDDAAASHCSMVRIGATPPFAESAVMHLVGWRLDTFAALPQTIRDYVATQDAMWREAPKDLEDIRRLQKFVKVVPSTNE